MLTGKKILFFTPAFFRYENLICDKMREMGASVDMYDVRSVTSAWDRALLKISANIFFRRSQCYYDNIIRQNKGKDYDYILIVKCDMTPPNVLERMKREFPHAKLCLYLWDSVGNIPGVLQKFKYFDTLHSFDPQDSKAFPVLKFRPLFFADQFRKRPRSTGECKYDLSFLGTIHADRYAVIGRVKKIAARLGLRCYWFLYLQSHFIYWFYRATKPEFWGAPPQTFSFEKKSASEIASIVDDSRIVLDVQHPKQTGLTMRTIEMVGMNKKLITTNASICDYDFYNPANICVIDRNVESLDEKFLRSPFEPIPPAIYEKYSLQQWILDVLD